MASGNILQGQSSGKLGDVVLMVRNGEQVSRVYTKAGARTGDQVSEAARIQRVKFGAASNQWGLYRYICTRMYRKGRKTNQSDYNYFVKRNQHLLPYLTKSENANGVHCLQPGFFSEGSLGRIELVLSYDTAESGGQLAFAVRDSQAITPPSVSWAGTLGDLKASLRVAYPNARKFTYLFSYASDVDVQEEGVAFASQQITHSAITIDLYNQTSPLEDGQALTSFFANKVSNQKLAALISSQTKNMVITHRMWGLYNFEGADLSVLSTLSLLLFATDDNASDCYTTYLPVDGVPPTAGAYSVWSGYRTNEALRVAADSYGYQSGVMRDDIASLGNDIRAQVTAYAAKLRSLDVEAADKYLKSVGPVEQVQAKVVRKAAPTEDGK